MKFALLTVTYSGLFYAGKALSVEEQILKARELGFDALAIETKRPVASPLDLTKPDRARLKAVAADQGIALCAVESLVSEYCTPVLENHQIAGIEQIDEGTRLALRYMKRLVDRATAVGKPDPLRAVV